MSDISSRAFVSLSEGFVCTRILGTFVAKEPDRCVGPLSKTGYDLAESTCANHDFRFTKGGVLQVL